MTIKLSELRLMVPYRLLSTQKSYTVFAAHPTNSTNIIGILDKDDLFFILSFTKHKPSQNGMGLTRKLFYNVKVIVSNKSIVGEVFVDIGVETDDEIGFPFEEVREDQNVV